MVVVLRIHSPFGELAAQIMSSANLLSAEDVREEESDQNDAVTYLLVLTKVEQVTVVTDNLSQTNLINSIHKIEHHFIVLYDTDRVEPFVINALKEMLIKMTFNKDDGRTNRKI